MCKGSNWFGTTPAIAKYWYFFSRHLLFADEDIYSPTLRNGKKSQKRKSDQVAIVSKFLFGLFCRS